MWSREPFSYQRHQDVAATLVRLRDEFERLGQEIEHCYGARAAEEVANAVAVVDRLRGVMHEQLDRDYPKDPTQVCNVRLASVYYPPEWAVQRKAG